MNREGFYISADGLVHVVAGGEVITIKMTPREMREFAAALERNADRVELEAIAELAQ